ncbi:MAG TPA: tetratricopeptide repeat protein [Verrucomicrobiae bacterium]|nr:tetratricopeptide repeat protein [Verrucomicrobiae bacterium]
MDYYPLGRWQNSGWGQLVREKLVLFALAGLAALAAVATELQKSGLMIPLEKLSTSLRVLLMFQSLAFYAWKLLWPAHLSPFYPMKLGLWTSHAPILLSVLGVGLVSALALLMRRRLPVFAAGWGAYIALVLPISGLVQTGQSAVAMRYAYLAILPLVLVAAGAALWVWRRSQPPAHVAIGALLGSAILLFGAQTRALILAWRNDETLWRTVLVKFPDSPTANRVLLHTLLDQGREREALECAQRNVELSPQMAEPHSNLALVLARLGRLPDAALQYEQAARIRPDDAGARYNLALALEKLGRTTEAIDQYQQALKLRPDFTPARNALARLQAGP